METESDRRSAIWDELERIEETSKYAGQTQLEQSKIWSRANLWLGIMASALAGIAGTLALANQEWKISAGVLALAAAVIAVILTTLNANARTNSCA